MKVVVTGASGFIGRHLVRGLNDRGHVAITTSRQNNPPSGSAYHRCGDVREASVWDDLDFDAIVHLAGLSDASLSFGRPVEYNAVNGVGTLVALEAARQRGARFMLASSQRVYRPSELPVAEVCVLEPLDPYGYSKLVAEQWTNMYHRLYGLSSVVLRFFSVYGSGQVARAGRSGVVAIFVDRALRGEDLVVYNRALRDCTYVDDVVAGILEALEQPDSAGQTYNLATGVATSNEQLARLVVQACRSRSTIRMVLADEGGESYVADISKAQRELNFHPSVGLTEGLERFIRWMRER